MLCSEVFALSLKLETLTGSFEISCLSPLLKETAAMNRGLRAFKRWMRSQGIEYSNDLEFTNGVEGIGVITEHDLKEGDLIATIPKSACLTIKTSAACQMIENAGLTGSLGLSVALMYERSMLENSVWDGYLKLLPEKEPVPLVWSTEEIDSLLAGTELHNTSKSGGSNSTNMNSSTNNKQAKAGQIVKEDKKFLYEDWKECILPLITSEPLMLNPENFGINQYFAAKSLVLSRSFGVDDYHGSGMVPLADLFNHKTGAENVHFTSVCCRSGYDNDDNNDNLNHLESLTSGSLITIADGKLLNGGEASSSSSFEDDPEALEMIIVKDVNAGDEVFNTYGSLGNAALLHRYGFTEPNNPFDIINIDLDLVFKLSSSSFSGRYSRARFSLWRRLGCSGCISQNSEYFEISSDGKPELDLLILLYIIFVPEEAYQKLSYTEVPIETLEQAMEILLLAENRSTILPETEDQRKELLLTFSVRDALVSLADIRESLYSSSIEHDEEMLRNCSRVRERKLYHSLVLRVSERLILKKLRLYASQARTNKGKLCSSIN